VLMLVSLFSPTAHSFSMVSVAVCGWAPTSSILVWPWHPWDRDSASHLYPTA
jgi:hypothetical protein